MGRKWLNATIYPCNNCNIKNFDKYPRLYIEREMFGKYKAIKISLFQFKGEKGFSITLPKKIARMLSNRIKFALEEKK